MQSPRHSSVGANAPKPTEMASRWILRSAAPSVVLGALFLALPGGSASAAPVPTPPPPQVVHAQPQDLIPLPLPTAIPLPLPTSIPLPQQPLPLPTSIPLPLPTSIPLLRLGDPSAQPTPNEPRPPTALPPVGPPPTAPDGPSTAPSPGGSPAPAVPGPSTSPPAAPPAPGGAGSALAQRRTSASGERTKVVRSPAQVVKAGARASTFPLLLLLIVGGFLAVQGRIDRGDPKLAGSAGWPERDLRFE